MKFKSKLGVISIKGGTIILLKANGEPSKRTVSKGKLIENAFQSKSWKQKKSIMGLI